MKTRRPLPAVVLLLLVAPVVLTALPDPASVPAGEDAAADPGPAALPEGPGDAALRAPAAVPLPDPAVPGPAAVPGLWGGFEENRGQAVPEVRFVHRSGALHLIQDTAVTSVVAGGGSEASVRFFAVGASPSARAAGETVLAGTVSSFRGGPQEWVEGITRFAAVRQEGVWPGVDVLWHEAEGRLKYDVVVHPEGDVASVRFAFEGVEDLHVDAAGRLVARSAAGPVVHEVPVAYEEPGGRGVEAAYRVHDDGTVGFQVGPREPGAALVIDPYVSYATYLGGSGRDGATAVAVDGDGTIHVAGRTRSADFPVERVHIDLQERPGNLDAFVAGYRSDGSFLYGGYLGGSGDDEATGLAVDALGAVWVVGSTSSQDFPVGSRTPHETPYQIHRGGSPSSDAFILRMQGGSIRYATYLGGSGDDAATAVVVDGSNAAHVVGWTRSPDFPATANGRPQAERTNATGNVQDAFVAKVLANGRMDRVGFLGGSGRDEARGAAVDGPGSLAVVGATRSPDFPVRNAWQQNRTGSEDAFVARLNVDGSVRYATYLGGALEDWASGAALDDQGSLYVAGSSRSPDFPVRNAWQQNRTGPQDAFLARYDAAGRMEYATLVGGSDMDTGVAVAVDAQRHALLAGHTLSTDFPVQSAMQPERRGPQDAFVARFAANGTPEVVTYLGSAGRDWAEAMAVVPEGHLFLVGEAEGQGLATEGAPQEEQGGPSDAFLAVLSACREPPSTQVELSGSRGDGGWWNSEVHAEFSTPEGMTVCPLARTDAARGPGGALEEVDGPLTLTEEGHKVVRYRSVDVAGNVEPEQTLTVQIDTTPPSTQMGWNRLRGSVWWHSSTAAQLQAQDTLSGVNATFYSLDGGEFQQGSVFTVEDGSARGVRYYSTDVAGNQEAEQRVPNLVRELGFRLGDDVRSVSLRPWHVDSQAWRVEMDEGAPVAGAQVEGAHRLVLASESGTITADAMVFTGMEAARTAYQRLVERTPMHASPHNQGDAAMLWEGGNETGLLMRQGRVVWWFLLEGAVADPAVDPTLEALADQVLLQAPGDDGGGRIPAPGAWAGSAALALGALVALRRRHRPGGPT